MGQDGDPDRFCMSRCRDSISALVSVGSPSRRDFLRLALAGSSLPFMRRLELGSVSALSAVGWRLTANPYTGPRTDQCKT
jgi:hypothetical protein